MSKQLKLRANHSFNFANFAAFRAVSLFFAIYQGIWSETGSLQTASTTIQSASLGVFSTVSE
jgi:hypothetical protein